MKTNEMQDLLNKLRTIEKQLENLSNQTGHKRYIGCDDDLACCVMLPPELADRVHTELRAHLQEKRKDILFQLGAEE